ncbi:MAG: hypothetical protein MJ225_04715 [Bacilli bacterium]|nr:hypothetical protein [Bacilli bacterium]
MRKLDLLGSKLCSYQAKIFEESLTKTMCSSKVFLRRFFMSEFGFYLDMPERYVFSYDTNECFASLLEEYGDSTYGKVKINANVLYYLGYLTRYICYTREITTRHLYKTFNIYDIIDNYYVFHTQDEEWVIATLLQKYNMTEKDLDEYEILKDLFRKHYKDSL